MIRILLKPLENASVCTRLVRIDIYHFPSLLLFAPHPCYENIYILPPRLLFQPTLLYVLKNISTNPYNSTPPPYHGH